MRGYDGLVAHVLAPAPQQGWQLQWNEQALEAYRLAVSTAPRSPGDYLLPNAAALTRVSLADDESFWQ